MYAVLDLFQCWIQYRVGAILLLYCKLSDFFQCIHVDVCLRNVNQNYRKKNSDHKRDKYLHRKLSTTLFEQAANKNTRFMLTKTVQLLFP